MHCVRIYFGGWRNRNIKNANVVFMLLKCSRSSSRSCIRRLFYIPTPAFIVVEQNETFGSLSNTLITENISQLVKENDVTFPPMKSFPFTLNSYWLMSKNRLCDRSKFNFLLPMGWMKKKMTHLWVEWRKKWHHFPETTDVTYFWVRCWSRLYLRNC